MRKSKISLALVGSLLSVTALAGCNEVTASDKGYILTYTNSSGEKINYSADELFGTYYNDSSSLSTVFDKIYKLIVRNSFKAGGEYADKYNDVRQKAQNDVDGDKKTARQNADTNGTSYDEEFNTILSSHDCEDEEELLEYYTYQRESTEFEDGFYEKNTAHLRDSVPTEGDKYDGYLHKKLPYHVRHILVKTEGESSSTNYWNSSITEKDARKLNNVVTLLANKVSFGQIASEYSEDTGSKANYGDLGIMDLDTSYVNPFKLGIYAYENLYNGDATIHAGAAVSNLAMNATIKNNYYNAVDYHAESVTGDDTGLITTIPYGVFGKLQEYSNVTRDENNSTVNDDNSIFYPRNIMFNKYLNRFSLAFITPNDPVAPEVTAFDTVTESTKGGPEVAAYTALPGFKDVTFSKADGTTYTQKVLVSSTNKPILVARAGTSDYQGVHFITIERDALVATENGVSLSEYYTTKYPGQNDYPQDASGNDKNTYVNFLDQDTKDYKSRAESVESKIKSFDKNLNKYIFRTYLENQTLVIKDDKLNTNLKTWMDKTIEKADRDAALDWEETWENYIHTLEQQKVERRKLVSEACAIGYLSAAKGDAWTKIGGLCNDNKAN
jgi:hypothetical protein